MLGERLVKCRRLNWPERERDVMQLAPVHVLEPSATLGTVPLSPEKLGQSSRELGRLGLPLPARQGENPRELGGMADGFTHAPLADWLAVIVRTVFGVVQVRVRVSRLDVEGHTHY